jgi:hypothetical protein
MMLRSDLVESVRGWCVEVDSDEFVILGVIDEEEFLLGGDWVV